jgi:2-methylisocitrate lyase-like PEP mutase family enzyme
LVINARTDVYIGGFKGTDSEKLTETITRGKAYLEAGADCIYPIVLSDLDTLKTLRAEISAPINVYANAAAPSMHELEDAGISRLSLGPWMVRASLAAMHAIATDLLNYGSYERFTAGSLPRDEIQKFLSKEKME